MNCRLVFALALRDAGPPLLRPVRHPVTVSSRASISQIAQSGITPCWPNQSKGALIKILSVSGSTRAPPGAPAPSAAGQPAVSAITRAAKQKKPPGKRCSALLQRYEKRQTDESSAQGEGIG